MKNEFGAYVGPFRVWARGTDYPGLAMSRSIGDFKAKSVGEGLEISSRTVSGGMRKLVTDGYVEKVGENPTVYSLTAAGKEVTFNE